MAHRKTISMELTKNSTRATAEGALIAPPVYYNIVSGDKLGLIDSTRLPFNNCALSLWKG